MRQTQDEIVFKGLKPLEDLTYAMMVSIPSDEYRPILRELVSYDHLKPGDNPLHRQNLEGRMGAFHSMVFPGTLHWSRQTEHPWALVEAELQSHHNVLTISNGSCGLQFAISRRCRQVIDAWYDLVEMPSVWEEIQLVQAAYSLPDNITLVRADVRSLPWPANWFDRVFCTSVLEHVPCDHSQGLGELVRVLKPGGRLILTLDIALDGEGTGENFFIVQEMLPALLGPLGIDGIRPNPNGPTAIGRTRDEGTTLLVVLVKYTKPKERESDNCR